MDFQEGLLCIRDNMAGHYRNNRSNKSNRNKRGSIGASKRYHKHRFDTQRSSEKAPAIQENEETNRIVGNFVRSKDNYGFVIPDNAKLKADIFIAKENINGALNGHKVVIELIDAGNERKSPEGKVLEIIGHKDDPGVDIMAIVKSYDVPTEFSEKELTQAQNVAKPVSEADMAGRKDLRRLKMVTIDGDDTKDFDDAVSISYQLGKYKLGVHIADVANYVQENSALDKSAKKRGCSIYLCDRVVPMLPRALSNGICSLNEGEDRLALSCIMTFDRKGILKKYEICESVINVDKRMTYRKVSDILEDEKIVKRNPEYAEYKDYVKFFKQMDELAGILRGRRRERGSVDFELPECKIELDKNGHPVKVSAYDRNKASMIIEDFMLAANETVAEHFCRQKTPFVYRVHEEPDPEKIEALSESLKNYGYYLNTSLVKKGRSEKGVHPKSIQKLLSEIAGTPEEKMISRLALRSMKQAKYSVDCIGHFGLACEYYCHFTSPIRRYPDLQIHRIIKDSLRGRLNEKKLGHYEKNLPKVCSDSSEAERRADELERETNKLKKVEFMEGHIGDDYDGIISGVTKWGIYVELENTVEGLVHISKLPGDMYIFDDMRGEIFGVSTGRIYSLGMPVKIRVAECDVTKRTIDFEIYEDNKDNKREYRQAAKPRKRSYYRKNRVKRDGKGRKEAYRKQ